ncbi:hypothetical protein C5708_17950 [Caulobacter sp. CCUG 60055]|uniref:hypothetical protein n=1 Tax=Caulobacter sp. CCUG 60055 TaxID=2100090 RepID=UPI001FA6DF11|nr:hypothetical protein [Caulobacter sp. CCUG 60055]MCI3182131.1 hypothetical protein [Caulobacter sp. CCUG 60055]
MSSGGQRSAFRSTDGAEVTAALARIEAKLESLSEIVVGRDGDGGLRADLRAMMSLRDRGLGMVAALTILGAVLMVVVKAWLGHLWAGGRP